jgi:hypothetical protein
MEGSSLAERVLELETCLTNLVGLVMWVAQEIEAGRLDPSAGWSALYRELHHAGYRIMEFAPEEPH